MSEIIYDCRWSDTVDEKFIKDFIDTENAVFGEDYTEELFRRKYVDNIYGKSVVVVVYIDGKPEGARGLWRNDLSGMEAYQPGDTCVTEACRGKGIFSEMTKKSVSMLPEEALIYNFPNGNSFPGYMKMGWKLVGEYKLSLFSKKAYEKENPVKMDEEYFNWWAKHSEGFMSYKCKDSFYLVKKLGKPFCFKIVAEVDKAVADKFSPAGFGFYFYRSTKETFYNKKLGMPIHIVSKCENPPHIPVWKMDVI